MKIMRYKTKNGEEILIRIGLIKYMFTGHLYWDFRLGIGIDHDLCKGALIYGNRSMFKQNILTISLIFFHIFIIRYMLEEKKK